MFEENMSLIDALLPEIDELISDEANKIVEKYLNNPKETNKSSMTQKETNVVKENTSINLNTVALSPNAVTPLPVSPKKILTSSIVKTGLVKVLSPIPSNKTQELELKTKYYMSPVRRSTRITPNRDANMSELWNKTNFTYIPNKGMISITILFNFSTSRY